MNSERKKFKKFYIYGSIAWSLLLVLFLLGKGFVASQMEQTNFVDLIDRLLDVLLVFGLFGIPIVFFFSVLVKLGAYIINRIPTKNDGKNKE